ncbi:MAG TPA: heparinase II/III-family protein, partial [Nocardioides sp.]
VPRRPHVAGRPATAPRSFPDAGIHLLRTPPEDGPESWCRCDGGPHGFLSIAAHAHADALSVEVRYDGTEVLVDPGTYCYHGEPEWRSYFRSTLAHNTIEIDGQSSSEPGGPFLWTTHADTAPVPTPPSDAAVQWWSARQRGYVRLDASLRHRRTVRLDSRARELVIEDVVTSRGHHVLRLALHLGPDVEVEDVEGEPRVLELQWPSRQGAAHAELHLPARLEWSRHRGEQDPPLGWYSPRFAERVPTTAIIGSAAIDSSVTLRTRLVFLDGGGSGSRG